jgi:hypothetical protein
MGEFDTLAAEEKTIFYILGVLAFFLSGLPSIVFGQHIDFNFLLSNIVFTCVVLIAAYGWLNIALSTRFLHKGEKANLMLAIGGGSITLAYFVCSYMLKEHLETERPQMLQWV